MSAAYPALLYKYLPPARADIFETGKLCFSHRRALNDPLEFHFSFDTAAMVQDAVAARDPRFDEAINEGVERLILKDRYREWDRQVLADLIRAETHRRIDLSAAADTLHAQIQPDLLELLDTLFRIFSCTENGMCVPMWTHYTENHTGFQIAFEPGELFGLTDSDGARLAPRPVKYTDERYVFQDADPFEFAYQKMADWAYEKEWRYSREMAADDRDALPNLVDFEIGAIREVTFALQATRELISRIRAALDARGHRPALNRITLGHHYRLEKTPLES